MKLLCAVLLCVAVGAAPGVARADLQRAGASADSGSFWSDVGLGAGAAVSNVVYIPAKLVYATVGGLVGGLAYLVTLGSTETANAIWEPTLGGTYVLTPTILRGEQKLHFNGEPPSSSSESSYREYDSESWSGQSQ